MRFITGGRAQGKTAYAMKKYHIDARETADAAGASEEELSRARLVYNLQEYIRKHHEGSACRLPAFREDAVLVCDESGCGVIPLSREDREFREAAGRICCGLAEKAESVELVRYGIAVRIK